MGDIHVVESISGVRIPTPTLDDLGVDEVEMRKWGPSVTRESVEKFIDWRVVRRVPANVIFRETWAPSLPFALELTSRIGDWQRGAVRHCPPRPNR